MNKETQNIKEQLEEVIKKNLKVMGIGAIPETTEYANGWNDCKKDAYEKRMKFTSLIADEVLKVVGERISEEVEKYQKQENYWDEMPNVNDFQKGALHSRNKMKDFILSIIK